MTNYLLQITLQSPLASSAGEGRVGLVDRDVAFDELGLPILPGRRLKGLWRDAYRDVTEAWALCGESSIPVEDVFGSPGQKPGAGDACLHIANAELQGASSLKTWLAYLQSEIQKLHPDDVVNHFATVRSQTAIDRYTGAAKEDTLRSTRALKASLVFCAPVRFSVSPSEELVNALALGAAALQHLGTARTRGLGTGRCRLLVRDVNGQFRDLTEQVLNSDTLPLIVTNDGSKQLSKTLMGKTTTVARLNHPVPSHVLRYRLRLASSAVIPVVDGDPNTVVTRQDIPGSHLWGGAAWHYLRQTNHTPADAAFQHAFLDGGLRFLAAYPEALDTDMFDETPQRLIPMPHSIRKFKDTERLVDLVEHRLEAKSMSEKEPTKRLDRRYGRIRPGELETQSVKTELNYHHARARDRRKGRALGAEVPNGGAFFSYEAIQADQSFQGAVLGSESDLTNLKTWLQGLNTISVGRSRSAQYGEVEFEWVDSAPQKLEGLVEWDGFAGYLDLPNPGKQLIITTLSPLLAVNDCGHPDTRFPERELVEALGIETSELTLSSSYARTEMIGGYHTHLRLPRQQWPAIAAGSVFVFDLAQGLNNECEERLMRLEHNGLGLRKGEGYGRIAVNRQNELELTGSEETQLDGSDNQNVNSPESEIPQNLQSLLQGVVKTRSLAEMQGWAREMTFGQRIKNLPTNSLLGRLRLFLQQDAPVENLNNLRGPAAEGLSSCRITDTPDMSGLPKEITLYDLFERARTDPEVLTRKLIENQVKELLVEDRYADTRQTLINQLVESHSKEMCKVFLNHLLTTLHRKSRL